MKYLKNKIKRLVNEEIKRFILKESMQPSFDWDEFVRLYYPKDRINYCYHHLGEPIGKGSSRIVFEIDDYTVLKVATNLTNTQNEQEVTVTQRLKNNILLPKIYGYDKYDYTWIWAERVIPATNDDFIKIMGVPYNPPYETVNNFKKNGSLDRFEEYNSDKPLDKRWINKMNQIKTDDFEDGYNDTSLSIEGFLMYYQDKMHNYTYLYDKFQKETYEKWLNHEWFKSLVEMFKFQQPYEFRLDNFGIAMRNGKPTIVVLDVGFED